MHQTHTTAAPTVPALAAARRPRQSGGEPSTGGRMELRKFIAPTLSQCLSCVRSELGKEAVVLSTRTVRSRRLLGLIRSEHIEITAGRGINGMSRPRTVADRPAQTAPMPGAQAAYAQAASRASAVAGGAALLPRGNQPTMDAKTAFMTSPAATAAAMFDVSSQVTQLSAVVGTLIEQVRDGRTPHLPPEAAAIYRKLIDAQVCPKIAGELVAAALDETTAALKERRGETPLIDLVRAGLTQRLATSGATKPARTPGRPKVVALVGPTGVGKTTTIAKLAASLMMRDNARVALITIDTYRIAAIDQLQKYAQILNVPLTVVSEPREIKDAIARVADYDYVLIDTAGRSPRDSVKLGELASFLDAADPAEVHLVLNACCGPRSLSLALQRFAGVRADRLIFTKLDEAADIGVIVGAAGDRQLPISYVTTGQDVSADMETADSSRLANLILTDDADGDSDLSPSDPEKPKAATGRTDGSSDNSSARAAA